MGDRDHPISGSNTIKVESDPAAAPNVYVYNFSFGIIYAIGARETCET